MAEPDVLFSDVELSTLELDPRLFSVVTHKLGLTRLTKIQADSFAPIVSGRDVLMRADTGSGKTLSYLVPIMQCLARDFPKDTRPIHRDMGPLVVIIAPTRELCLQISSVLDDFRSQMPYLTPGTLLGGEKMSTEKKRIRSGITILVATPGRILYHIHNSQNLTFPNLQFLVLDEADRLLDLGFLSKISELIENLPPRQTILVSATLHSQLQTLQELSLRDPVVVGELQDEEFSVPPTLCQRFVVVSAKWRLAALAALLRRCTVVIDDLKCIIFINCCLSVDFHYAFFNDFQYMTPAERRARKQDRPHNPHAPDHRPTIRDTHASTDNDEIGGYSEFLKCPIFRIHGNVDQIDRVKTISRFTSEPTAILFCTDVAARGLDIPAVNTIIQYDPPIDTEDYVHRVGRTARIGHHGIAYLFLQEFELGFVRLLSKRNIEIQEYSYDRLVNKAVQAMGGDNPELCMAAMRKETMSTTANPEAELAGLAAKAWASSIKAYTSHRRETKDIFNKTRLHLGHMAAAFGLEQTPGDLKEMLAEERELVKRSRRPDERAERPKMLPAFEERVSEFL
jgi:ATP-dependent RNA helicase DDX31/DBP7